MRKPNGSNEFLIDVTLTLDREQFIVYDLTMYFNGYRGIDRDRYMAQVNHTIKGKKHTIFIIDRDGVFNNEQARRFAIRWYKNNNPVYRLD